MATSRLYPTQVKKGYGSNSWISVSSGGAYAFGKSGTGHWVTILQFKVPGSVSNITGITLYVNSYSTVGNGYTTRAKLNSATPQGTTTTTPAQWLSHTALSTSTEYTGRNYSSSGILTTVSYTFSSGLSSLTANTTFYIWLYGTSSSSYSEGKYTSASPYIDITYSTGSTTPVEPTSIIRKPEDSGYSGFYSSAQWYKATSSTPGYYFVTTDSPWSSSAVWYKRQQSTSNANSCTFTVDRDTSTTSSSKTYYLTVIPNYSSQKYIGAASSNHKAFYAPKFAFRLYNNSSSPTEINSSDYPDSLPDFGTISGGYVHQGYSSQETSKACDQQPGYSWSATYDGKTRYAVYKRAASTTRVTLNANGGSISSTSASKTTPESWIYGKGTISGSGSPTYSNSYLSPTRSGYTFLGWATSSSSNTIDYTTAKDALDSGYTGIIYAVWERNSITLTFYRNGGSGGRASFTLDAYVGSEFKFPDKQSNWYKTGYTFKGWGDDNHPNTVWWAVEEPRTWQQNDPTSFYAIWEPDEVTLTYQPDSDTGIPDNAQSTSYKAGTTVILSDDILSDGSKWTSKIWGSSETITLTYVPKGGSVSNTSVSDDARYDWVLGGWSLSEGGSKSYNFGASVKLSSDMTLYPYWRDSDELKAPAIFTLLTPTRSGYKFLGWDTNSEGAGTRYQAGEKLKTTVDTTLYAIWEPEGAVYINNGSKWEAYSVWIYHNNAWRQAIPYVYTNGQWKMTTI